MEKTVIEKLNEPREDGYPKVIEITSKKVKNPYHQDRKDKNFDLPISYLTKEY